MWKFAILAIAAGLVDKAFAYKPASLRNSHKVVCYLGSWANYRNGDGKFLIENIDPTLCTHYIYGFAKLGYDNKIAAYDPYLDLRENWGLGAYERFNNLKKNNSNLKTLLAIGGWNEGSTKYSTMAKSPSSRKVFVESCVQFLTKYGFDGLDLDWEYPAMRGGIAEDKKNFIHLLMEMKEAFKPYNLLLTAAVSAGQNTIDAAYDIPALAKYLDFINLMAYDFHGGWDRITGHNAPLYSFPGDINENAKLNVDYAVNYWLQNGVPAQKLILGMPLYGRSFSLQDPTKNGLNEAVNGKGMAGDFTREQGFLGYNEICNKLQKEKNWKLTYDSHIQAPYAVNDRQWIGFDNIKSITAKVEYLLSMNLGGAMVWSIETDDFRGKCHDTKFPLLRTINSVLNGASQPLPDSDFDNDNSIFPVSDTSSNERTFPAYPVTQSSQIIPKFTHSPSNNVPDVPKAITGSTTFSEKVPRFPKEDDLSCKSSGYFRHPDDCRFFYVCQSLKPGFASDFRIYLFTCGAGTVFSEKMRICAFPTSVPECYSNNK